MPFHNVIGHRHLLKPIARAVARDSLPPSLLFTGPDGVGKRLVAEALAQVLNCSSVISGDAHEAVAVDACGRVVVTEESPQTGGFGGEVVATVVEESFWSLEAPVVRVSGFDVPYPVGMVEDRYIPDEDRIAAAVRRVLDLA